MYLFIVLAVLIWLAFAKKQVLYNITLPPRKTYPVIPVNTNSSHQLQRWILSRHQIL